MATKPNITVNTAEEGEPQALADPTQNPKQKIYPEINQRLKDSILWLGLAFVVMVILVQNFSGYS
jgi:hypothetical protein